MTIDVYVIYHSFTSIMSSSNYIFNHGDHMAQKDNRHQKLGWRLGKNPQGENPSMLSF